MTSDDRFYTNREVRTIISRRKDKDGKIKPVTYKTLKKWRDNGWIPCVMIRGSTYYPKAQIDEEFEVHRSKNGVIVDIEKRKVIKSKAELFDAMKNRGVDPNKVLADLERSEIAQQRHREILEDLKAGADARAQLR